jgi:hypothetical protein
MIHVKRRLAAAALVLAGPALAAPTPPADDARLRPPAEGTADKVRDDAARLLRGDGPMWDGAEDDLRAVMPAPAGPVEQLDDGLEGIGR